MPRLEKAITLHKNKIQINLDMLNAQQIEVIHNSQVISFNFGSVKNTKKIPVERLNELQSEFIHWLEIEQGLGVSVRDHRSRTGMFLTWLCDRQVTMVEPEHWLGYYEDIKNRDLSPTTIRNYLQSVRKFAGWLTTKKHLLPANPLANVKAPKPVKKDIDHKAVKSEVAQLMIDNATSIRDQAVFLFFRDTGCRISEAGKLTWGDINFTDLEVILLGKQDKPRAGYLKQPTADIMTEYRHSLKKEQQKDSSPVWWGLFGSLTPNGIYQIFRRTAHRIAKDAKFNPHAWRHLFGREATRKGMPTAILQLLLGHESIETTTIYTGVSQEIVKESYRHYIDENQESR